MQTLTFFRVVNWCSKPSHVAHAHQNSSRKDHSGCDDGQRRYDNQWWSWVRCWIWSRIAWRRFSWCYRHNNIVKRSTQTAQTSANANIWNKSINPDLDVRRIICPKTDNYLVGVSHFDKYIYKSVVDCMRHANKCPQIPYSAMVKKMKKWSGIHTWRVTPCPCLPSLVDVRFAFVILSSYLQNDRTIT